MQTSYGEKGFRKLGEQWCIRRARTHSPTALKVMTCT